MINRFAALAALMIGAILADIQVVRITTESTTVGPVPAGPAADRAPSPAAPAAEPASSATLAEPAH